MSQNYGPYGFRTVTGRTPDGRRLMFEGEL